SACGLDLLGCRAGELVRSDVQGHGDLTGAENLHGLLRTHSTLGHEVGDGDVSALGEQGGQLVEVDNLERHLRRVLEPTKLRQTHVHRSLAALEAVRNLVAGLRALGSATGGLALRSLTATHAGLGGLGSGGRTEVVQLSESLFDISIDLFHSHEVTHGIDHSPDLGAIVLHHDVVGPLETERTQRVTLALTATDGGLVLSNFELCHQDFAPLSAAARSNACG